MINKCKIRKKTLYPKRVIMANNNLNNNRMNNKFLNVKKFLTNPQFRHIKLEIIIIQ